MKNLLIFYLFLLALSACKKEYITNQYNQTSSNSDKENSNLISLKRKIEISNGIILPPLVDGFSIAADNGNKCDLFFKRLSIERVIEDKEEFMLVDEGFNFDQSALYVLFSAKVIANEYDLQLLKCSFLASSIKEKGFDSLLDEIMIEGKPSIRSLPQQQPQQRIIIGEIKFFDSTVTLPPLTSKIHLYQKGVGKCSVSYAKYLRADRTLMGGSVLKVQSEKEGFSSYYGDGTSDFNHGGYSYEASFTDNELKFHSISCSFNVLLVKDQGLKKVLDQITQSEEGNLSD